MKIYCDDKILQQIIISWISVKAGAVPRISFDMDQGYAQYKLDPITLALNFHSQHLQWLHIM